MLYEVITAYRDRVLLAWADERARYGAAGPCPGACGTAAWEELLHLPETRPVPEFPLRGADLLERGWPPRWRCGWYRCAATPGRDRP